MNETRRKPTTGRQSPTLFDKWHGIFYMPSRIDEAGHTKAFDDPVAEHWGESQRAKRSLVGLEPTSAHTYESEIQRSTTYATPTAPLTPRIFSDKMPTVQLSTFLKWNLQDVISYKSVNEDGKELVTKIWCHTCARHFDKIKADQRIRGQAKNELKTYVDGTTFITKHNVTRHLGSMVKFYESLNSSP